MSRISAISSTTPYLYGHISSGNKLMSAADGAAELAIVEKEKAQVTGYNTGTKNLNDGTNMLNTSDSALGSITGHLQRMRELGLRASSSILNDSNRADIQKEIDQLKQGIEHIATQTRYNGMNLLDGSMSNGVQLVSDASGGSITVNHASNSTLQALGIADFDVTKDFDLNAIDNALSKVTSNRSTFGAQSNSLDYAIDYNDYAATNLTAAQSRMGDTDIAKALQELTHQQTMQSISMMLQKRKAEQEGQKTMGLLL
ncbi:flagellin [Lachnospiraceae bacterium]|jgi:flagellin|nr:flagellin [Lachnospiraceae bacterium]